MEHIARNAANHLISTTYGQYNCGKFKLEYVSNSISFKFSRMPSFSSIVELNILSGIIARITVAKETI